MPMISIPGKCADLLLNPTSLFFHCPSHSIAIG